MKTTVALLCLLLTFTNSSCAHTDTANDTIAIGTFNIAWLGDGNDDMIQRTEQDFKNIAHVIEQTKADVLAIEEIENPTALQSVLKYLPDYAFQLGNHGNKQNVGVLYKKEISAGIGFEYLPVATNPERNRPGFVCSFKKGNFDFTLMTVHLKSTSRADSTPELRLAAIENRIQQTGVISHWIDSVLSAGKEQDIFVVGDFNDFPTRDKNPTLTALVNNPNITFVTNNEPSCNRADWKSIDHIVATQTAAKRFVPLSIMPINFNSEFSKEVAEKISDHCPVVARFSVSAPDND